MKTRLDFVSNSSSSSYVFSFSQKSIGMDDLIGRICAQCLDKNDLANYLDADIRNRTSMAYHLRYTELMYLGEFALRREKITLKPSSAGGSEFEYYRKMHEQGLIDGTDEEHTSIVSLTADEITLERDVMAPRRMTVSSHYMAAFIRRPENEKRLIGEKRVSAKIAKNIVDAVNVYMAMPEGWHTEFYSDIYAITRNTVKNTRDLIKQGYAVKLREWENLDGIQARLNASETIFRIAVSDSGGGGSMVFSLNGRYPFMDLPLERLDIDDD